MSAVCPNGHTSASEDYCDTCGSPIDASAVTRSGGTSGAGPAAPGAPGAPGGAASGGDAGSAAGRSSLDLDPEPGGASTAAPSAGAEGAAGAAATAEPTGLDCPNCHFENVDGALFCEACGYDFTTGAMPRDPSAPEQAQPGGQSGGQSGVQSGVDPATSSEQSGAGAATPSGQAAFEWVAEVWIDPDWYATQEAEDPCPSPGLPIIVPLRTRSALMGRVSSSKNTHPEIDLSSDPGVSRRHAQLTTDGSRWFVEDLGSSNGTFVGAAAGPLPIASIAIGPKTELDADDRLYVGAWTRVVVRAATPDEVEAYA